VMPGFQTTVTEILPFNQTISITLDGKTVILGNAVARYIFVERAR